MFRRLTDFGYQRTLTQAIGLYLVYLVVGLIIAATLGGIAGATIDGFGFDAGIVAGATMAIVACPLLSLAMLHARGQLRNVKYLLVVALSVVGAVIFGLFLGLACVAFLSTRPAAHQAEPVEADPTFA